MNTDKKHRNRHEKKNSMCVCVLGIHNYIYIKYGILCSVRDGYHGAISFSDDILFCIEYEYECGVTNVDENIEENPQC